MSQMFEPDSEFGKYRIVRFLGTGGMSDVWEAVDTSLQRNVALKILPSEFSRDEEKAKRFQKEVLAVAALNHPGIVTIYEVGEINGLHFYAMVLVTGGNLKKRILRQELSPHDSLKMIQRLAGALRHAHDKGIIHRDIKPENILFTEDGYPILADFGIAKIVGASTAITAMGMSVGTPYYMSPEQADPDRPIDHRTDIYSMGVVLYEMLSGAVPYDATTAVGIALKHLNEPVPELPDHLAALQPLLNLMLAKNADERIQSADLLFDTLDEYLAIQFEEPSPAPTPSMPVQPQKAEASETEFDLMAPEPASRPATEPTPAPTPEPKPEPQPEPQPDLSTAETMAQPVMDPTPAADPLPPEPEPVYRPEPAQAHYQPPPQQQKPMWPWIGGVVLVIVLAAAGYFFWPDYSTPPRPTPTTTPAPVVTTEPPPTRAQPAPALPQPEPVVTTTPDPAPEASVDPPEPEQPDTGEQIRMLLMDAEFYLAEQKLTSPPGENALESYRAVLAIDPRNPRAIIGIRQLAETYLQWGRDALNRDDLERSSQYLRRAREVDPAAAGLASLDADINEAIARKQAEEQRLAAQREEEARLDAEQAAREAAARAAAEEEARRLAEAEAQAAEEEAARQSQAAQSDLPTVASNNPPAQQEPEPEPVSQPDPVPPPRTNIALTSREFSDELDEGVGPRMMALPPGVQTVGSNDEQAEQPVRQVRIDREFAVGKFEVTRRQFALFVDDSGYRTDAEQSGGCNYWLFGWRKRANKNWRSPGFRQTDGHPVVCVSRNDARAYADWLGRQTGHRYGLPSEAQWEYAARAGTEIREYWKTLGHSPCRYANVSDLTRADEHSLVTSPDNVFNCSDRYVTTAPAGSLSPNEFDIHDMLGNVGEWMADCWYPNYEGAPSDASARLGDDCDYGVVRGGSWFELPANVTTTYRVRIRADQSFSHIGFRVVRLD